MTRVIYLTNNSKESLERLEREGFHVCICCKFKNTKWLDIYIHDNDDYEDIKKKGVHGTGYGCENECKGTTPMKCVMCGIKESIKYKYDIHIFNDVDDMLEYLNTEKKP